MIAGSSCFTVLIRLSSFDVVVPVGVPFTISSLENMHAISLRAICTGLPDGVIGVLVAGLTAAGELDRIW